MTNSPDWSAGYRAGLALAWSKSHRIRGDVWSSPQQLGAPDDASEEWVDGFKAGLWARR